MDMDLHNFVHHANTLSCNGESLFCDRSECWDKPFALVIEWEQTVPGKNWNLCKFKDKEKGESLSRNCVQREGSQDNLVLILELIK